MKRPQVVVLKTKPESVLDDYEKLMHKAGYENYLSRDIPTLLKLNLSWTKYFPACSSQPWQLEGVVRTLLRDGFSTERLIAVENKTVVTDPIKGARNNKWSDILEKHGVSFLPLPDVEWIKYEFQSELLKLNRIFPKGIEIPKLFIGKNILHLPTVKTHGHSVTTGAIKNAFGGLLKEVRHYAHKYIHEVLVDLLLMQKELHPGMFCVMDGTVCGDGAGPRTMDPKVKNVILAGGDSVAIDAIAAKIMGFEPLSIPYIRMCHERGLGVGDPREIEILGEDIAEMNFQFTAKKSFVIWGDQMLRIGFLRPFEKIMLHSPLVAWAPFASNIYHDCLWYPTAGRKKIRRFFQSDWGALWKRY
ncbi:MAG: DUF362 domain-containing protein [Candidatus Aminicenantes bacterium]|nr:DUF362 domain-containing protein [Candidatus Aminicenantes bacterium]